MYVTDTLRLIASREGYIKPRYAELIAPEREDYGGGESAEEIIARVVKNAGLVVE